jgi:hypothetical protein
MNDFKPQIRSHPPSASEIFNGRDDKFLLKGNPHPSVIQRMGAWLFGFVFVSFGFIIFGLTRAEGSWLGRLVALGLVSLGLLMGRNGFSRKRRPK